MHEINKYEGEIGNREYKNNTKYTYNFMQFCLIYIKAYVQVHMRYTWPMMIYLYLYPAYICTYKYNIYFHDIIADEYIIGYRIYLGQRNFKLSLYPQFPIYYGRVGEEEAGVSRIKSE